MPGDAPTRPRGWLVGALGVIALMAFIARWSIEASGVPNGFIARRGWEVSIDGPWRFPHEQVRTWLTVMLVEGSLAVWVLAARLRVSLAARSGLLGVASAIALVALAPLAMHASAPFPQHVIWLALVTGWLFAFSLGAALAGHLARAGLVRRAAPRVR
jgi:hypothetical protein